MLFARSSIDRQDFCRRILIPYYQNYRLGVGKYKDNRWVGGGGQPKNENMSQNVATLTCSKKTEIHECVAPPKSTIDQQSENTQSPY